MFAYEELFQTIFYLGPLREVPRRIYPWTGERPSGVGQRGELAIPALLAARSRSQPDGSRRSERTPTVEETVARWLRDLGLVHSFEVRPIAKDRREHEVHVRVKPNSTSVLITDVGFGVSQILPVLALCAYVPKHSILLLEQPEIHLHPAVQAGLADVLIDAIRNRSLQILVESYSEHLLHRLQRCIAEEKLSKADAVLYFCSTRETGESQLTALKLDEFGNITNWPKDFFGDEMGDLVAMTQAEMKRKQRLGG